MKQNCMRMVGETLKGSSRTILCQDKWFSAYTPKTETIYSRVQGTVLDKHKTMLLLTKPHTNLSQ